MHAKAALLLLLLLAVPAARARPPSLVFCHEDQDSYPWVLKDRPGLNVLLIRQLEREIGVPIRVVALPWMRCLAELTANSVDGAFSASFKAERLQMGRYPTGKDGKPDPALRLHMASYSLYRPRGSALYWNGSRLENLQGAIGTLAGHSIIDVLREMGAQVDDRSKSPVETLRKVALGRLQGAVLQTSRASHLLGNHPDLAAVIERDPAVLDERPYFLLLSFKLVEQEPAFSAQLWKQVERVRESPQFKRTEQDFYGPN
jgi:polar amino acid transport system substrate-binding protein